MSLCIVKFLRTDPKNFRQFLDCLLPGLDLIVFPAEQIALMDP